jgi:riboflavin kinase, archaea type
MNKLIDWPKLIELDFVLLLYIVSKTKKGFCFDTTTIKIAKDIGISQQSVSRQIINLQKEKLIQKKTTNKGIKITLEKEGFDTISTICQSLTRFRISNFTFSGKIVKGFGEGKYYMSKNKYKKLFDKSIGYVPYPGTLNIKLDSLNIKNILKNISYINIPGFIEKNRSYGNIKCYPCLIHIKNKDSIKSYYKKAHIIIPLRSSHDKKIIEIIAPLYLRKELNLIDNNEITVSIER